MRRAAVLLAVAAIASAGVLAIDLFTSSSTAGAHEPSDFTFVDVITNLDRPTGVEVAPNGDVFVIEKNGKLKVFDGLNDPTADVVVDWQSRTMATGDQGMLGLAVDPQYGNGRNYVYVHYVLDEIPGENDPPHWNDSCPLAGGDGCVVTGSLARIEVNPATNAMVGWIDLVTSRSCFEFKGHTTDDLAFGPDGYLYASFGDGASFTAADYGQIGDNPCEDPPHPAAPTTSTGQGGALRSQDLLTSVGGESNDPVWYNGVVIRVDPDTGAAAPGNPLAGGAVTGDDRIIAHGLRNPFRMDFRPGTEELWIGDVGWAAVEELNVVADVNDATVENFGWPCYEGPGPHPIYSQYGLCQTIVNDPGSLDLTTQLTDARFPYDHSATVGSCGGGSSAIGAIAFGTTGSQYPSEYDGALFFNDYARGCLWAMLPGGNGVPDPSTIDTLATGAILVDIDIAPNGDLLAVDVGDFSNGTGRIRRLDFLAGNSAPTAVITANTLTGTENETLFEFSGTDSSDPEGEALSYEWDLDGDGDVDATGPTASTVYTEPGSYDVRLTVTDPGGASGSATVTVNVSNTAPVPTITSPLASTAWRVGDEITFSGAATDAEDGALAPDTPGQEWEWTLILHHCPGFDCHQHIEDGWTGVGSGSFVTPDHEYPSWLELSLVVTDSTGSTGSTSVELQPRTSNITLDTNPAGLQVAGGLAVQPEAAPVAFDAIEGGDISVVAPSPQTVAGVTYAFDRWSDGGDRVHDIVVPLGDLTLTAEFVPAVAGFQADWTGVSPSDGWSYWWNESGPLGASAGYSPLQWNGSGYNSTGSPIPTDDEFAFGQVLSDRIHPGRGSNQTGNDDRYAIVRYTIGEGGRYGIVGSELADLDCASGGIEVAVLVNDTVLSSQTSSGGAVSSFDQPVGILAPGDTVDVALGPDGSDSCDTTGVDFYFSRTEATAGSIIADFRDDFTAGSPTNGWAYHWNERSALGDASGYEPLVWNSVHYDSDGVLAGPSPDQFSYGRVSWWGAHPGRSVAQGSAADRHAIIQFRAPSAGAYSIVDSMIANRGCPTDGVEVTVLAGGSVVTVLDYDGQGVAGFDTSLGQLDGGDMIEVAVGPGSYDTCDAVDLDFSIAFTASETGVVVAEYGPDFAGPTPNNGWSYLWNESSVIGDSAGYTPLLWNSVQYDSDGQLGGATGDEFSYGLVAQWGVHSGRSTAQGSAADRFAIVRYTASANGSYRITGSAITNRGCVGTGVELQVLVNDQLVTSTNHLGSTPTSFDTPLGNLAAGDTVDVAVGPGQSNVCDAVDLDFGLTRDGTEPPETVTVGTSSANRGPDAAASGWTFWWNEVGELGNEPGYTQLVWNGAEHDSDGIPGVPSADELRYGLVGQFAVHPGSGTGQGAALDRHVIVRYTVTDAGSYDIVSSVIDDLPCATIGGVDLTVLVDNVEVYSTLHFSPSPGSFDRSLGTLLPGATIDVALGPNGFDWCDATNLDFTLTRTS